MPIVLGGALDPLSGGGSADPRTAESRIGERSTTSTSPGHHIATDPNTEGRRPPTGEMLRDIPGLTVRIASGLPMSGNSNSPSDSLGQALNHYFVLPKFLTS